jgi:hypothetical protein
LRVDEEEDEDELEDDEDELEEDEDALEEDEDELEEDEDKVVDFPERKFSISGTSDDETMTFCLLQEY